jgi:hypothetical protein
MARLWRLTDEQRARFGRRPRTFPGWRLWLQWCFPPNRRRTPLRRPHG